MAIAPMAPAEPAISPMTPSAVTWRMGDRGASQENVKVIYKHYHAPISNTGTGVLVLENTFI
jgi:hypothetical protein